MVLGRSGVVLGGIFLRWFWGSSGVVLSGPHDFGWWVFWDDAGVVL
jgi:hypothetical protein